MQDDNNKNFILAIGLSVLVIVAWQYFYAQPQMEMRKKQLEIQREAEKKAGVPGAPKKTGAGATGTVPGAGVPGAGATISRAAALAKSPRVTIDTPLAKGSISLTGGRIDDLTFKNYKETIKRTSDLVTLLSPAGGPNGYFIEHGWVSPDGTAKTPTAKTVWSAPAGATLTPDTPLELSWDNGAGLVFKRTISVDDGYLFTVKQNVQNNTAGAVALEPYGRIVRLGTPTTEGFFVLHEGIVGFLGEENSLVEIDYDDAIEEKRKIFKDTTGWLGITDKYWATALMPKSDTKYTAGVTGRGDNATKATAAFYQTDFQLPTMIIGPGKSGDVETNAFAGAKQVDRINKLNEDLKLDRFDLLIDWGWFWYITKPLFFVIDWLNKLFGNFGVAILITTVLVKALFFPLANKSYVSMSRMKKLQPEMERIRKVHEDDKQRQQQEMMKLYQKEKVNPLAGCLPILLQIPVFFALYKVLFITIEMRHAPFFGWIQDLSAPDPTSIFNLFGLLPYGVPTFLMVGIWPIIMGITMWVQMKLNPAPTDEMQKKIFTWMPIIFTFMLASFPAGLVIYWAWNNLLSVTQQAIIMTRQGVEITLWDNLKEDFSWLRRNKSAN